MTLIHLALRHLWLIGTLVVIGGAAAIIFRGRVKRMMRLAKAAATDPRLPKHVRWLFRIGLLAKALPIDFGIDEAALGLGVLLLATRYRKVWAEIRQGL